MIPLISALLLLSQVSRAQTHSPTLDLLKNEETRSWSAVSAQSPEDSKNVAAITTAGQAAAPHAAADPVAAGRKDAEERAPIGDEYQKDFSQPIEGVEVDSYQTGPGGSDHVKPSKSWKPYALMGGGLALAVIGAAVGGPIGAAILGFVGGVLVGIGALLWFIDRKSSR